MIEKIQTKRFKTCKEYNNFIVELFEKNCYINIFKDTAILDALDDMVYNLLDYIFSENLNNEKYLKAKDRLESVIKSSEIYSQEVNTIIDVEELNRLSKKYSILMNLPLIAMAGVSDLLIQELNVKLSKALVNNHDTELIDDLYNDYIILFNREADFIAPKDEELKDAIVEELVDYKRDLLRLNQFNGPHITVINEIIKEAISLGEDFLELYEYDFEECNISGDIIYNCTRHQLYTLTVINLLDKYSLN